MREPDYDRIHERETNRWLDSQFTEPGWTDEDRADAIRDDAVLELRPAVREAGADGVWDLQTTD